MGSVTGQACRFEKPRVIKQELVCNNRKGQLLKELKEQAIDSPRSAARAFHIPLVLLKKRSWKGCSFTVPD